LIFRKVITIVATRGQILRLNAPDFILARAVFQMPLRYLYNAPPGPLAGFKGA